MISRFIETRIQWEKTYHPAVVLLGRACCWVRRKGWKGCREHSWWGIIRHDELHLSTLFTCSYWYSDVWYLCCCDTLIGKVVDPCRQVWIAPKICQHPKSCNSGGSDSDSNSSRPALAVTAVGYVMFVQEISRILRYMQTYRKENCI